MSDLLSGLRVLSNDAGTPGRIYNSALADAQWRLRNPTDEQVEAIARAVRCICKPPPITDGPERECGIHGDMPHVVRAVLAAAAGGDDE